MRRFLAALLLCGAAHAEPMCGIGAPSAGRETIEGYSANGQWLVSWNIFEDTGVFNDSPKATMTRTFCVLVGKKTSFATLGTRAQSIRTAADPQAAFDTAWAQYVKTPITDPSLAGVRADMCADVGPKLKPFTLEVCK